MAASVVQLSASLSSICLDKCSNHAGLRLQHEQGVSLNVARHANSTPAYRGLNIRCARVAGIEIPNNKRIEASLTYIHGIGKTTARQVLLDLGFDNKVTKELSEEELTALREEVNKYMTEGDLRRYTIMNIKNLKDIRCYRGLRHIASLPCRGQHTKCNARTRRGKKVTVAGKKK